MLNIPPVVAVMLVVFALVHAFRTMVLTPEADNEFLLLFSFIPARFDPSVLPHGVVPGGLGAELWTFVTYALIHGSWTHLGVNAIWFVAFGSAVARRFGTARFLLFFAVTAVAGALAHLLTHAGELVPMIGASASISGFMAAAARFAFQRGGPIDLWRARDASSYRVPALPLLQALANRAVLIFLVVWFVLNILFGAGSVAVAGEDQPVAWQAHIGGFLAGLFLFPLFDPVPGTADADAGDGSEEAEPGRGEVETDRHG